MRRSAFKYCSLIIGLFAALTIILSQTISFSKYASDAKKVSQQTEKSSSSEEPQSEETHNDFSISATGFPSASGQIGFFQEAICIFELVFDVERNELTLVTAQKPLSKFFSTIFSVIISPNAP